MKRVLGQEREKGEARSPILEPIDEESGVPDKARAAYVVDEADAHDGCCDPVGGS